jgi:hypothetical protein
MSLPCVVNFEHKDYTWDGRRWYSTLDYMTPPAGIIHKLNQLLPKEPAEVNAPAKPRP